MSEYERGVAWAEGYDEGYRDAERNAVAAVEALPLDEFERISAVDVRDTIIAAIKTPSPRMSAKGATVMTADECKPGDRVMYGPYPATIVRVWNFDSVEIMQDRDHGRSSSTHPDALRRMSAKSGSEW